MKSRHHAREIALQILYYYDPLCQQPSPSFSETSLQAQLQQHCNHFQVPAELRDFIDTLVIGTLLHQKNIDTLIEKNTSHWKISRMSVVDRSLLRLAVYEMVHLKTTAPTIIINEAIELSKQYGASESASFVNGVLDAVARNSI
jgi:N utilization substance protein B